MHARLTVPQQEAARLLTDEPRVSEAVKAVAAQRRRVFQAMLQVAEMHPLGRALDVIEAMAHAACNEYRVIEIDALHHLVEEVELDADRDQISVAPDHWIRISRALHDHAVARAREVIRPSLTHPH